ncbi:MAG: 23S rRNA (uracil(747)-C(5))-methyltransferase RlmC [Gammaproteobacteria bacterium]|nr:23S rRNA (uracil(747)-C(5))-methyltransferase RlmC [Gammaproteobacteria bacterium]
MEQPYAMQLQEKQSKLLAILPAVDESVALRPVPSATMHFRNKAKMVVMGTASEPILGIVNHQQQQIDLTDCPLYPLQFGIAFQHIIGFIKLAGLQPYDVEKRTGELKFVLLTRSNSTGQWMLRFVMRSQNFVAAMRKHLPTLQQQWPELCVCSVNLQPEHKAVLEGEVELILTAQTMLPELLNDVPMYIQPQSFFQTNPILAAKLYQTARDWTADLPIINIWDLFCGVGGFALHLAAPGRVLTGIEISASAIACASQSAALLGLTDFNFQALDAAAFAKAQQSRPDLLVVNPPRRGLGAELCATVAMLQPNWLLYSSCNPQSLSSDLALLAQYKLRKVQLFDFFPHTTHAEVLCLLQLSTSESETA